MNLAKRGENTSPVEVTHISSHGVWLLVEGVEYFMPYEEFPWFRDQPVKAIIHVEQPAPGHLYWPDMDVDLSVASIENPGRFELVAK